MGSKILTTATLLFMGCVNLAFMISFKAGVMRASEPRDGSVIGLPYVSASLPVLAQCMLRLSHEHYRALPLKLLVLTDALSSANGWLNATDIRRKYWKHVLRWTDVMIDPSNILLQSPVTASAHVPSATRTI
jgi:hypothetical protein